MVDTSDAVEEVLKSLQNGEDLLISEEPEQDQVEALLKRLEQEESGGMGDNTTTPMEDDDDDHEVTINLKAIHLVSDSPLSSQTTPSTQSPAPVTPPKAYSNTDSQSPRHSANSATTNDIGDVPSVTNTPIKPKEQVEELPTTPTPTTPLPNGKHTEAPSHPVTPTPSQPAAIPSTPLAVSSTAASSMTHSPAPSQQDSTPAKTPLTAQEQTPTKASQEQTPKKPQVVEQTPIKTPQVTAKETPAKTPQATQEQTPAKASKATQEQTPAKTPKVSTPKTPKVPLEQIPTNIPQEQTPTKSPRIAQTPAKTQEQAPIKSPRVAQTSVKTQEQTTKSPRAKTTQVTQEQTPVKSPRVSQTPAKVAQATQEQTPAKLANVAQTPAKTPHVAPEQTPIKTPQVAQEQVSQTPAKPTQAATQGLEQGQVSNKAAQVNKTQDDISIVTTSPSGTERRFKHKDASLPTIQEDATLQTPTTTTTTTTAAAAAKQPQSTIVHNDDTTTHGKVDQAPSVHTSSSSTSFTTDSVAYQQLVDQIRQEIIQQVSQEVYVLETEYYEIRQKYEKEMRGNLLLKAALSEYEQTIKKLIEGAAVPGKDEALMEKLSALEAESRRKTSEAEAMETAFNDLRNRYEEIKVVNEKLKMNEQLLKETIQRQNVDLSSQESRFDKLKLHAETKLDSASEKLAQVKSDAAREVALISAKLQKAEARVLALEEDVQDKENKNKELLLICDDLLQRVEKK